jgi:hypothetical protein
MCVPAREAYGALRMPTSCTRLDHGCAPSLPADVLGMIIREAWFDETFPDRTVLFLSLICMRDRMLLQTLLRLAWKHPVCRTFTEFRFYLRLRYGSLLEPEVRGQRHESLIVEQRWLIARDDLLCARHQAEWTEEMWEHLELDVNMLEIPFNQPLIYPASSIAFWSVGLSIRQTFASTTRFVVWLQQVPPDQAPPTRLMFAYSAPPFRDSDEARLTMSSVTAITILTPNGEGANWGAACHTFPLVFPSLKSLTLLGTPTNLLPILRHLPPSLEHITLDAQRGIPGAPYGTVHLWRLIPALRQGFRIGVEGTASPEVTILGGTEEPTGWPDAVRIVAGMGVRLSREVMKGLGHHTEDWIARS